MHLEERLRRFSLGARHLLGLSAFIFNLLTIRIMSDLDVEMTDSDHLIHEAGNQSSWKVSEVQNVFSTGIPDRAFGSGLPAREEEQRREYGRE